MPPKKRSTVPSYSVRPDDGRVMTGLVPVELPGRSPALPPLYRYVDGTHPQVEFAGLEGIVTYIYLVDASEAGKEAFLSLSSSIRVPRGMIGQPGGNPELQGLVALKEGDALFARDICAAGDPWQDVLQILVATEDTDDDIIQKRAKLAACRDRILGARESRDGRRVWFEEQDRAKDVGRGTRCYGLSNMHERPKNLTAPPAALKVIDGQLDAVQLAVKELVRAGTDYNITMWTRMAPESLRIILESYSELVNAPHIGCDENYMWSSCQLNIAEPQRVQSEQPLGITNGKFGDSHTDEGDTPTHLSCATVLSDIPDEPGWEPGRMHFLGVGCYTVLSRFKQFFFTGLLLHGSTRPLVAPGVKIPKWACRAMFICYPNQAIVLGTVNHGLGVLPGRKRPFSFTSHMSGAPHAVPSNGYFTSHATTSQDGTTVMDDTSLVNFHARALLCWAHWLLEFLPSRLGIEIDADKFLDTFSYTNSLGERIGLKPWVLAPAADVNNPYEDRHVSAQTKVLDLLYNRMAKGIPSLSENPFEPEYLTARGSKTRPATHKIRQKKLDPLPEYDEDNPPPLPPRPRRMKRRRSPRKHKRTQRKDSDDESSDNESSDDESPDDELPVHIAKRRRKTVDDDGELRMYKLRASVRQDTAHDVISPVGLNLRVNASLQDLVHSTDGSSSDDSGSEDEDADGSDDEDISNSRSLLAFIQSPSMSHTLAEESLPNNSVTGPRRFTTPALHSQAKSSFDMILLPTPESTGRSGVQSLVQPVHIEGNQIDADRDKALSLKNLRALCTGFNVVEIEELLSSVLRAVIDIPAMGLNSLCGSTSSLDEFYTVDQPFRMAPVDLSKYMTAFSNAKQQQMNNDVWSGILRQRIILHEHRLAQSVLDIENVLCPEIVNHGTFLQSAENWIEYLLRDVRVKIVLKQRIVVSSKAYLPGSSCPPITYTEPDWSMKEHLWTRARPTDAEFSRQACVCVGRILRCWFDLPGSYITKGRAHLVDVLVSALGPGVLYLESVWRLHRDLPRQLYRDPPRDYHTNQLNKDRPYDPSKLDDFVHLVKKTAVALSESCRTLDTTYRSFTRLVQVYVDSGDSIHPPSNRLGVVCNIYDRRCTVIQLIRDTLVVISHQDKSEPVASLTPSQDALAAKPDSRLCLREAAPSRKLMMDNVDKAFMRTRPGLFTALIFRNIFFNSPAFILQPESLATFKFVSLEDWTSYVTNLRANFEGHPDEFFCNPSALGQPIAERTLEQGEHFWQVSVSCEWPDVWPVGFMDMHNRLHRIKNAHGLPGCGALGLYLLCADMVYYGMVDEPSVDDMARIILALRKGAFAGLHILGYLTVPDGDSSVSVDHVKRALEDFKVDVDVLLAANGLSNIRLNAIDLEHILCKFTRMWSLNIYRTSS